MEGPFARSPDMFSLCGDIVADTEAHNMAYEVTNLGLRIRLMVSPEIRRKLPFSMVGDRSGNFRWAGLNCLRIGGGPPIGIWLSELTLHKDHRSTGQYMRANSQELHPGTENLPLRMTEIYVIESDQQVMMGLGAFRRRRELEIDKPCSIDFSGLRPLTYKLHHVEGWKVNNSFHLADVDNLAHVSIPVKGQGTLLFKNASHEMFGIVLDLKADGLKWDLTYSSPSYNDDVEMNLEYVHHQIEHEPDQVGGFLSYGEWATGYFTDGYDLSLKVDHSVVLGQLGFAMRLKSSVKKGGIFDFEDEDG